LTLDSQVPATGPQDEPAGPSGSLASNAGGAIYVTPLGSAVIANSVFTDNVAIAGGAAIFYGTLPAGCCTSTSKSLAITHSLFQDNCSGGPGGALATSLTTTVSDSSFIINFADASGSPCVLWSTNHPGAPHLEAASQANAPSISPTGDFARAGGAIFNRGTLGVAHSTFLTNSATVTTTGGGGAIENYFAGGLVVNHSTFADNTARKDGGAIYNAVIAVASMDLPAFSPASHSCLG
jgi:hypothetical protein